MDARSLIERFVETYNRPGSDVYPLFGDQVAWAEFPGGRSGGRVELFAALREAREQISDLHLEVLSLTADRTSGVIESLWSGVRRSNGAAMRARTIWFLAFKDGKIVEERDYSIPMPQA